jgi:uncharacterized membrane protein
MTTPAPVSRDLWYAGVFLIFVGLILNLLGLLVDFTAPNFFQAFDYEIAGIIAIFFGVLLIAIYELS